MKIADCGLIQVKYKILLCSFASIILNSGMHCQEQKFDLSVCISQKMIFFLLLTNLQILPEVVVKQGMAVVVFKYLKLFLQINTIPILQVVSNSYNIE